MSAFTGPLVIEEITPGNQWRLVEPLRYEAGAKGSGLFIEVPKGFETDGASLPGVLRLVLAVWGSYGRAACVHDYLYSVLRNNALWDDDPITGIGRLHPAFEGFVRSWGEKTSDISLARAWADHEFYTAMLACGTSRALAFVMWAAVRVGGTVYGGLK